MLKVNSSFELTFNFFRIFLRIFKYILQKLLISSKIDSNQLLVVELKIL